MRQITFQSIPGICTLLSDVECQTVITGTTDRTTLSDSAACKREMMHRLKAFMLLPLKGEIASTFLVNCRPWRQPLLGSWHSERDARRDGASDMNDQPAADNRITAMRVKDCGL